MESRHEQWSREADEATMTVNIQKYIKLESRVRELEAERDDWHKLADIRSAEINRLRELEAKLENAQFELLVATEVKAERDRLKAELGRCREMYLRDADTGEYYSLDEILKLKEEVAHLTELVMEHQTYNPKQSVKEAVHE
jgi:hypothetical protein